MGLKATERLDECSKENVDDELEPPQTKRSRKQARQIRLSPRHRQHLHHQQQQQQPPPRHGPATSSPLPFQLPFPTAVPPPAPADNKDQILSLVSELSRQRSPISLDDLQGDPLAGLTLPSSKRSKPGSDCGQNNDSGGNTANQTLSPLASVQAALAALQAGQMSLNQVRRS